MLPCCLLCPPQQVVGTQVVLEGDQDRFDATLVHSVHALGERDGPIQILQPLLLVPADVVPPALVEVMPTRGKAGAGVEADAQLTRVIGDGGQVAREIPTHFNDRGRAVTQERSQAVANGRARVLEAEDSLSADAFGWAIVEEARAEHVTPPGIQNHAVARMGAHMNVGVDESRNDQVPARIDGLVHRPVMALADMEDRVAAEDDDAIFDNAMLRPVERDDPAAADQRCLFFPTSPPIRAARGRAASCAKLEGRCGPGRRMVRPRTPWRACPNVLPLPAFRHSRR